MPFQPTPVEIRLNNVIDSLKAALTTLDAVSEGLRAPFLQLISNATRSLLAAVQFVRLSSGIKMTVHRCWSKYTSSSIP
ncbi:hypothetical protein FB451DRAFT_1407487 [Mycena latifolia]|nr:hypothetical protein FB451DRAFT_1407487 [Mycena latifolia]